MALVLAGGWAFFFWQSSAVDLAAVDAVRTALTELRAVDSGWNQQLVNERVHPGGAAPAAPSARYRNAYAALEVRALRLGDPRVGSGLSQLKVAFDEKAALMTRHAAARAETARADPADTARQGELQS